MAKRKRLTPLDLMGDAGPAPAHHAPVARIAAEAATQAALDELATELRQAREGGRLVLDLPLSSIKATHLQRDRMHMDPEDMASLKASIHDRGQQMPIEVVALPDGRYGLISGARRLAALTALQAETQDSRFAIIKALLRPFEAGPEAYLAMVEENEIRADLSFYERGRLAHEAARLGIFASPAAAVKMLFQHAPAPKRSKIMAFVTLHEALGDVLRFPEAIPEKLGLALVKAMQGNPSLEGDLRNRLSGLKDGSAFEERQMLEMALRLGGSTKSEGKAEEGPDGLASGIRITARPGQIILKGQGVTKEFIQRLKDWVSENE